jgi:hypothetical protein
VEFRNWIRDDKGLQEKWYQNYSFQHTAHWPGSVEEHILAAKGQQLLQAWQDKVVAWYSREFPLPSHENGTASPTSMLQLTFGACGYETMVWLNGVLLRTIEGDEVHVGEYTSFSYELPEENLREVNSLTVRIADTMDADIPAGSRSLMFTNVAVSGIKLIPVLFAASGSNL